MTPNIGASLSLAASSGASQSGPISAKGGTNFGTPYGPGSLLLTNINQPGSFLPSATGGGVSWAMLLLVAAAGVVLWLLLRRRAAQ